MAARSKRASSRSRSSHVEPLISSDIIPKQNATLIFIGTGNKISIDSRRDTDSFAISNSRNNTDSFSNYFKPSITPLGENDGNDSDGYRSTLTIHTVSKMCIYYLVLFISFALIILFIIRISNKMNDNKSIDIILCIVSSVYFISVIIISIIFIHQYLYKIIDKDEINHNVSIKNDPHPEIRYMPRSNTSKLKYFITQMFCQFNRFQISVIMCFIHQLIFCFLYILQFQKDIWNIAFFANKLLGAFGFILPSICVHIYCKEKNYIATHFWRNSELSSTNYSINSTGQSQTQRIQKHKNKLNPNDIDRETKAIAASASLFANKMLMGCLCLGYIVQIVLFMAEPFWQLSFYKDIEGANTSIYLQYAFHMNQLIFRSFVGIFLTETIIVIMFVMMNKNCVNPSFKTLFLILKHPLWYLMLIIFILIEIAMTLILKDDINNLLQIPEMYRAIAEIVINSFWMVIHLLVCISLLKYTIIGKLIYEEKLKRKISVFYAYVPSNISWFVTECMLLLLICVCYLTQLSLNNASHQYDRFDVYRQWIIILFLSIQTLLLVQYQQIYKCESFKKYFSSGNIKYIMMYFKILIFIDLLDFFYIMIFQFDYFYREYYQNKGHDFESFAFAFCFGIAAFILLNLSHCIQCYLHWKHMPMPGIEMSTSDTLRS